MGIAMLSLACLAHTGAAAPAAPPPKHMPVGPVAKLPFGAYPGYRVPFQNGECDANDPGGPGSHPINTKKRCFSCFRIPAVTINPRTGSLHAFAEARRGDLGDLPSWHGMIGSGPVLCPDVPDTTVAYKRSTNSGASWSPLKILQWEEGHTHGQPTPVVDNVTGAIFMAYGDVQMPSTDSRTLITVSHDDGLSWANATAVQKKGGGIIKSANPGIGRGFVIFNASLPTKTRLILPTESGSLFSDDHGISWTLGPFPAGADYVGENSIARCTPGACGGAPGGAAKFAMVHRGAGRGSDPAVGIHFSNDSIHWTEAVPLPGLSRWSNYSQAPGLIAVPGGLILSHGGLGNSSRGGEDRGRLGATVGLGHGDGNGVDLFFSKDGLHWTLRQHVWPFTGTNTGLPPPQKKKEEDFLLFVPSLTWQIQSSLLI